MNFRTEIPINNKSKNLIDYNSSILLFGSCFSGNIGEKLNYFKFNNSINPFGILFHPKAIETLITNVINEKNYTEEDVFFYNERWHCYETHSDLSSSLKEDLLSNLNSAITTTHQQLTSASHIIFTLGTSWVYRFIESDSIVANCHKIPQKKFLKELLSVDEINSSLEAIISLLKNINPKIEIIFTVSPVRHLKDGFTENSLCKAHLISAIHEVVEPRNRTHYFPSFEIMMDDLRDYRFYNNDMIHPNETAINYIWNQFKETWIHPKNDSIISKIDTIQKGLSHRPFNEKSELHQKFIEDLQLKISQLKKQHSISF